jgi:hypothetical protein
VKGYVADHWPGLVPIWLADDLKKVTKQYASEHSSGLIDLFYGTTMSDCPLPCSTIRTETKLMRKTIATGRSTSIMIFFSPTVQVTTTDFVLPAISTFLSDLVGSLGLWLGLGVVQALELGINCVLTKLRACRDPPSNPLHYVSS